jgi:protein-S-isoprenylcysteine O-methyltransferase Ste14
MNDHEQDQRPAASGRVPDDAPGGPELEGKAGDWDDAAMDRFWLGVYSRLERGLAWTLVSASAAVLLGYGAYQFATEFMTDASVPTAVRFGAAGLLLGILLLLLGALRERIRALSTDPFRRVRR